MTEWRDEPLDNRRVCQKRRRSKDVTSPAPLDALPGEWRELLKRWVQRGGNSRWETLLKEAGVSGLQRAEDLRNWLMRAGWAATIEQWKLGAWWPHHLELRYLPQLRAALGLRDNQNDEQRWLELRSTLKTIDDPALFLALEALEALPVHRALARYDLITALNSWQNLQQTGTRRDFAFFARGNTKAVSNAEWDWLEHTLDLSAFNIERHTPMLLISAPISLQLPHGQLDLAACPDFASLTPATLADVLHISGTVTCWHLVENRTSFERTARQRRPEMGVIWLPGFPPSWWMGSVQTLLQLAPAPARIACDPDPAGIAIALQAAQLWLDAELSWQPWHMSSADLAGLAARKPLSDADKLQLTTLQQHPLLPKTLAELIVWMQEHGEKGEQEGYV